MSRKRIFKVSQLLWSLCAVALGLVLVSNVALAQSGGGLWTSAGQDVNNTRHQSTENKIGSENVADLVVKWEFATGGDVSATPAVDGTAIYFPDFAGNLYALDRGTGALLWQRQISEYTGVSFDFARTTPAIHGNLLILGDQGGRAFNPSTGFVMGSARVMAVDSKTGDLVWVTQVDSHPGAIVTQSATVQGNTVYVGVASYEEAFAGLVSDYDCCSFRGSILALDANTGEIRWKTYTAPEGYSGNAVWGSSPVVDTKRNSVYIGTGNNYSVPADVSQCILAAGNDGVAQRACLSADNYFDAVVSLDIKTGAVKWSTSVIPFDTWNVACLDFSGVPVIPDNCPQAEGPDFDFGQAPMLYTTRIDNKNQDFLGIGQKSGVFWSLNPDTGAIVWSTQVSPGGVAGGMIWGSASDGTRLYTSSANSELKEWVLPDGSTTNSGIWSALNPATGEILWQTASPSPFSAAGGAASVANGVVYVCSQNSDSDNTFALDAATGAIQWGYPSGGFCNSGAAIVNGAVYWGYGYPSLTGSSTGGKGFIAFGLP